MCLLKSLGVLVCLLNSSELCKTECVCVCWTAVNCVRLSVFVCLSGSHELYKTECVCVFFEEP